MVSDLCDIYLLKTWGTFKVKAGLAQMAKGGIIMDVTTAEEARVAENAGVGFEIISLLLISLL